MCRPFPFLRHHALSAVCRRKTEHEAFEQVAALVETESAPADTPQETEPLSELAAFEK